MDEEDRYSNSSNESDRDNDNDNENDNENENDADEAMEDADDGDNDAEGDDDNNDEDDEDDGDNDDNDNDGEGDGDGDGDGEADGETADGRDNANTGGDGARDPSTAIKPEDGDENDGRDAGGLSERQLEKQKASDIPKEPSRPGSSAGPRRPKVRQEALTAELYDIVPTMAAPQATSINALAVTPDLRYWFTGGSDGYIRKYDGPGTINGKLPLTVAQKHPFVDSVTKAGILMSYWGNEDHNLKQGEEEVLSPVYSLAVHSQALWLLSGLETGGINLQSVRHDEGKHIHCLRQHTNAVSVLKLAQDERSVLSGSWDKNIFDWCLDTGKVKRSFDGSAGQIAAIELRPASGKPVPAGADEPLPSSTTIATNNGAPMKNEFTNGSFSNMGSTDNADQTPGFGGGGTDEQNSPGHDSLFGGSDTGDLFGETADAGDQPFGHDEDDFGGSMGMMHGHGESGMDHSADMAMAGMDMGTSSEAANEAAPVPTEQPVGGDAMEVDSVPVPASQQDEGTQAPATNGSAHEASDQNQLSEEQLRIAREIKEEDGQPPASQEQHAGPTSPIIVHDNTTTDFDPSQMDPNTFLSAATDGTVRIWDRRVPNPTARIGNRPGVPPWCMSACWSPDGNMIYAGRRNGTVEEYDVRKAKRGWEPERILKFPAGSGPVSAVKPMVNGRHLVW